MNILDQRLLCAIISNQRLALDFSNQCDSKFFLDSDAKILSSIILKYIRTYRSRPTKRVLLESTKETAIQNIITKYWDEIENINYNEADYNFDLVQCKNRYIQTILYKLQKSLFEEKNIENGTKLAELTVNEIRNVNKKNVFMKETLKEHTASFKEEYVAKCNDPSVGQGILTGYSLLDYIRNGLRPADLWIVASETGGGKSM